MIVFRLILVTFLNKLIEMNSHLINKLTDNDSNHQRTHQGKMCCGRTPIARFIDEKNHWKEKVEILNQI